MSNHQESAIKSTADAVGEMVPRVVESAARLGAVWARHGLSLASLAIKTQADSFRHLSTLLEQVVKAIPSDEKPETTPADAAPKA